MNRLFPNGFMPSVRNNSDALLRLGAGLLGGQTGQQQAALGLGGFADARQSAREKQMETQKRNRTVEFLRSVNPQLAQAVEMGALNPGDAYREHLKAQMPQKPTDDIREYKFAKDQGFEGSFADWMTSNRGGTTINLGEKYGKAPTGFSFAYNPDGSPILDERGVPQLYPMAGGPAAQEMESVERARKEKFTQEKQQASIVRNTIADLEKTLETTGFFDLPETGVVGGRLADMGLNQEAVDVSQKLATLQSSVAFDRLQRMREASPTGGALGAVSERELLLLQNSMGALTNITSEKELLKTLKFIDSVMAKFEAYPDAAKRAAGGGIEATSTGVQWSIVE